MTKAVQDLMVEVERVRDAFHAAIWDHGDVEAALALVTPDCRYAAVPVGPELDGVDALRGHLADAVVPHRPADAVFTRVTRTGSRFSVVDESRLTLTHDRELPWLLPGVVPTGRRIDVLVMSVTEVRKSRITAYRTLVDHVGLCRGLGLDECAGLPVPAPASSV